MQPIFTLATAIALFALASADTLDRRTAQDRVSACTGKNHKVVGDSCAYIVEGTCVTRASQLQCAGPTTLKPADSIATPTIPARSPLMRRTADTSVEACGPPNNSGHKEGGSCAYVADGACKKDNYTGKLWCDSNE